MNHEFCRVQLRLARKEAKDNGVEVPRNITALSDCSGQYFIESRWPIDDMRIGEYVSGDCAYDARAKYIYKLIDRKMTAKP